MPSNENSKRRLLVVPACRIHVLLLKQSKIYLSSLTINSSAYSQFMIHNPDTQRHQDINKTYLPKYLFINIQCKLGEKKHLRHFFHTFSEVDFVAFSRYLKNAAEEDSTHKFPQLRFPCVGHA